jgi:23S rRNA pseudouridine2605 synthase
MHTARRIGLARRLSKLGICSRSEAERWVRAGRLRVDGQATRNPEFPTIDGQRIELDGTLIGQSAPLYLMLNKPRGLTTSTADEQGRATVYDCLQPDRIWSECGAGPVSDTLPWLAPVGRLDRASEGLLLFCNDPEWAAAITDGDCIKTYHVRIERLADAELLARLHAGIVDRGERLQVVSAEVLRPNADGRSRWLALSLDEGRNRHIRRLLAALGMEVQRLIRVRIGALQLGELPKGRWRALSAVEVDALRGGTFREPHINVMRPVSRSSAIQHKGHKGEQGHSE